MTNLPVKSSGGYTLIEILMAVTLSLILMLAVVQIFAMVGDFVTNSQAIMEMDQNIRNAQMLLQLDLSRITAKMNPPLDPSNAMGYFMYTEGNDSFLENSGIFKTKTDNDVINLSINNENSIIGGNLSGQANSLQFTIHDLNAPLLDYNTNNTAAQSQDAEVYWFVDTKNRKLYRKIHLLTGDESSTPCNLSQATHKYAKFDNTTTNLIPVLRNVIKFDVQVWDNEAREYKDGVDVVRTGGNGYDTGNRFDNYSTPTSTTQVIGYHAPKTDISRTILKGLRIKVRVVEPTTGQIRDFTVDQDFTGM